MALKKIITITSILVLIIIAGYLVYQYYFKPHPRQIDKDHLLKTKWSQLNDYSKYTPDSSYIGCWSVALSQILYYHRCSPEGDISYETDSGLQIEQSFDDYLFDFDNFENVLNENLSVQSIDQTARYLYYSALVLKKNWQGDSYLDKKNFPERMKKYYNCIVEEYNYKEENFEKSINDIKYVIKQEIDSLRPILYYFDNEDSFGHACVVDGYHEENSDFLVHLNLGWGGYMDGWYNLENRFIRVLNDRKNRIFITIKPILI